MGTILSFVEIIVYDPLVTVLFGSVCFIWVLLGTYLGKLCYLALRQTQGTLKSNTPGWQPWLLFFLKALQQQKSRLQIKIEREHLLLASLPELSLNILEFAKTRGRITISEIVVLTGANRNTVKKHLETLVKGKHLEKFGVSKGAWYAFV